MARNKSQANPGQLERNRATLLAIPFGRQSQCSAPVNAILNYAYTVLESGLRIKAIAYGYAPTIGLMHEGRDGSSKFVFDLMEPERPMVDREVLDFVKATVFDPADFTIRGDGVVRLNPQLARYVAGLTTRSL
jgi:CRISPR-associated protein Cas1